MSDFIHLHNHTHYSLQDGACTVDGLINAAKKHNMKSVAITDHGVMYGAAEFYKKAKKEGIKPIIGMEAYIVLIIQDRYVVCNKNLLYVRELKDGKDYRSLVCF